MRATALCLLVLAAVSAGFVASSNGPAPARLVGTYSSRLTKNYPMLGFYKGRYLLSVKNGNEIAFTILDAATFPNKASYSSNRLFLAADVQCTAPGSYSWTLRANTLELKKLRDPCIPRAVLLSRTWRRVS